MYTIQEVKEEIKAGLKGYLLKDEDGSYRYKGTAKMPFYVEGKPGMGKTEIIKQIANELGIGFVSFSITHHTRSTLLGLPVIVEQDGYKYTEYTMSEIIAKVKLAEAEGHKEGILLLDEFNCASETIFPMMLALLQTRNIGYYTLPEGWNLVLLGNPRKYNKGARELDAAILDRVRKFEVDVSSKDFLSYATEQKFHPVVLKYLTANTVNLYYSNQDGEYKELVTCRGWENLSHAIYAYEELNQEITDKLIRQFIKSEEITDSFYAFYKMNRGGQFQRVLKNLFDRETWSGLVEELKKESLAAMWRMNEQLVRQLELSGKSEEYSETAEKIGMAFQFLELLPDGENLKEHFFGCINCSAPLRTVLLQERNEEYLEMCRNAFALDIVQLERMKGEVAV